MGQPTREPSGGTVRAAVIALAAWISMASTAAAQSTVRRDPFWPLGYRPATTGSVSVVAVAPRPTPAVVRPSRTVITAVSAQRWEDAEREVGIQPVRYSVGGRGGGQSVVLLAGKIKAEGDLVQLEKDGVRFTWRVASISRNGVRFERRSADILTVQ